ncbi:MAG: 23S rRNA (uracil(1939)-C(5))-methyltransferase RlmD [Aquificaceae bacterium]|nr:23S rRNA (uracil(1939)-C(5))-methyltransferase RlmD [Aquificaceae bacterium]
MKNLKKLLIKKLLYGGYGLAEAEDKAYMVDYALPGELVEADVYREKKDHSFARTVKVLIPSLSRRDAPCPYYGTCGGCQLQHLKYNEQLKLKEEILLETLSRIGKVHVKSLEPTLHGGEFGYRIRVQFKVSGGRLGFFERRSHNLVDVESCLLVHPSINGLIPSLRELSKRLKSLKEIHVFYSPHEKEFILKLFPEDIPPKEKLKKSMENLLTSNIVGVGVYHRGKAYSLGRDLTFVKVGLYRYRVSIDSFLQVNYLLWDSFVEEAVPKSDFERVLELHCGVGFFSLFLANRSRFLVSYDSNRSAIRDAEYNAKMNSLGNISFEHGDGFEALRRHAGDVIDLLFLDPPRSGLSEGEAKLILQNKPKEIVYVSCEPTTLARDLKTLLTGGYYLASLRMVDNFPNTYHIEAIAHIRMG